MEYIEREAAIKCCTFGRTSLGLVGELRRLPAADVRPVVRGRWAAANFHTVKCSICGFEMDIMTVDDHVLNHANYCTNCGADMRKEEP